MQAAVTFGDPFYSANGTRFPQIASNRGRVFCALGDAVCLGQFLIFPAHLSYGSDTDDAARFVAALS
jgi:cutinase